MPLRRGDRLTADELPRPRVTRLLAALAVLLAATVYGIPLLTTADPLWPLPTAVHPDALVVHWAGSDARIGPGDPRYAAIVDALNDALRSVEGIEYAYGLRPDDVAGLRSGGRALEAFFDRPTRIHGAYAVGSFTALLVPLAGPEADRRLILFGDAARYRAAPLRTRSLDRLRAAVAPGLAGLPGRVALW